MAIKILDVSTTEVFLRIEINSGHQNSVLNVYRDGRLLTNKKNPENEIIVVDSNLASNTNYYYEAEIRINQRNFIKSNKVFAQTLVPTSHEFGWQQYYFEFGSTIEDIEIVDEKNIWAVGSIWKRDSLQELRFYNGLFWNGEKWEFKEIPSEVSPENNSFVTVSLQSLFASTPNDIWFTTGGQMIHWDGTHYGCWTFLFKNLEDTSFHGINKMNGIPEETAWAVGNKGNIFLSKKNGEWMGWKRFENNITEDLFDVLCIKDLENSTYIPVTNFDDFTKNIILRIDDEKTTQIESVQKRWASSLFTKSGFPVYLAGDGVFENKNEAWEEVNYGANKVIERIRGNGLNDIIAVGHFGIVAHFNGINWRIYNELQISGIYNALSFKGNLVAIAGSNMGRAIILLGSRK